MKQSTVFTVCVSYLCGMIYGVTPMDWNQCQNAVATIITLSIAFGVSKYINKQ
jgi:ribose/xylose/arabinose/galactoside ABC-type transport system permease subunit